ncbi:MAG: hypothetical protein K0S71_1292 [Clostridia bacterium]|jgi:hypothetical protein|nr:hypothetical protein [Clostridia bacterium]
MYINSYIRGNKIENISNKKIYTIGFIASMMHLLFWVNSSVPFALISMILILGTGIFSNYNKSISLYYFLLPNMAMLKFSENGFAILSMFLIILFLKIIFTKKTKLPTTLLILMILYIVVNLISYSLEEYNFGMITQDIRVVIDMLMLISIISLNKDKVKDLIDRLSESFVMGTLTTALCGLIYQYIFDMKFYNRLEAVEGDPNFFALVIALSISILLLKMKLIKFKLNDLFLIMILFVFGLLSYSRGFIVSMIPNMFMIACLLSKRGVIRVRYKIIIFSVLTVAIIASFDLLRSLISSNLSRFFLEESKGGSGRLLIWDYYLRNHFTSIKYFLIGTGRYTLYVPNIGQAVQHNIYIEAITGKGLIGTIIIYLMYSRIFLNLRNVFGVKKIKLISLLPIITLGIAFMFLNGLSGDIGVMTIILSILIINRYSMKPINVVPKEVN